MERNGFDLQDYQSMLDNTRRMPESAKITFDSRFSWDGGFGGDAHVTGIEQLGETMARDFVFRCDVPKEFLGHDSGTMPAERLLSALGQCIGTAFAAQATKQGIDVQALEVEMKGRLDLRGFLELSDVRPGLNSISTTIRVTADTDDATLQRLGEGARDTSPIFDSLAHPVGIELTVERA